MAEDKFGVVPLGTDTSGRGIFMTRYMQAFWETVVADLGFRPLIVQGAWMLRNGGGADASSHTHDKAGCLDMRSRDFSDEQKGLVIRTCRRHGAAAWLRNEQHGGMDEHIHLVLGGDSEMHPETAGQWQAYLAGRDGLASGGRDYHIRPDPLVTSFDGALTAMLEEDMQLNDPIPLTKNEKGEPSTIGDALRAALNTRESLRMFRKAEFERDEAALERHKNLRAEVAALADQLTELGNGVEDASAKAEIKKLREKVSKVLKDTEPD